jgi:ferrous iron transport protein B
MIDQAQARGLQIDAQKLSELLGGTPVIPMAARRGLGLAELKQAIITFVTNGLRPA